MKVWKELRERILAAADELEYSPNLAARRLSTGSSATIGFVYNGNDILNYPFWGQLINGIQAEAQDRGNDFLLIRVTGKTSDFTHVRRYCREKRIAALVVPGVQFHWMFDEFSTLPVPVVAVLAAEDAPFPMVGHDIEPGYEAAAAHLATLGHRRILWVGLRTSDGVVIAEERKPCFARYAGRNGLQLKELLLDEKRLQNNTQSGLIRGAYEQLVEYMNHHGGMDCTAVMAYNESAGIGFSHALRDRGLRVPDDVSIIGYDNLFAEFAFPPLSTISMNLEETGRRAAEFAFSLVEAPSRVNEARGTVLSVPNEFIIRGSTGPARAKS